MPIMLSYQLLATATNKTEEQVREDKKNQLVDLDSLNSVVEYVARSWGWTSPEQAVVAATSKPEEAPLPRKQYSGTSTVKDNVEPSGDPYLDRTKSLRNVR
jgi:hypothetical protein